MRCPYMEQCQSPQERGTGPVYQRRFCLQDCTGCARFRLAASWAVEDIPLWLRPTMMVHADWLLEQWHRGVRNIPASMPQMIPLILV
ncbi:MAG: hypothetical protein P1U78_11590 [Alcanivoracaceae bacterium]|nr:hypothetical protein [Alcanivoracaceae bacterium]